MASKRVADASEESRKSRRLFTEDQHNSITAKSKNTAADFSAVKFKEDAQISQHGNLSEKIDILIEQNKAIQKQNEAIQEQNDLIMKMCEATYKQNEAIQDKNEWEAKGEFWDRSKAPDFALSHPRRLPLVEKDPAYVDVEINGFVVEYSAHFESLPDEERTVIKALVSKDLPMLENAFYAVRKYMDSNNRLRLQTRGYRFRNGVINFRRVLTYYRERDHLLGEYDDIDGDAWLEYERLTVEQWDCLFFAMCAMANETSRCRVLRSDAWVNAELHELHKEYKLPERHQLLE